jgi:hypothetical protein
VASKKSQREKCKAAPFGLRVQTLELRQNELSHHETTQQLSKKSENNDNNFSALVLSS